jgi:hypothetical protein
MSCYTTEEVQDLFDFLNLTTYNGKTFRAILVYHTGFLGVETVEQLLEVINNLDVRMDEDPPIGSTDANLISSCKEEIVKVCHDEPLDSMPLYVNDTHFGHIAKWRLRIAK